MNRNGEGILARRSGGLALAVGLLAISSARAADRVDYARQVKPILTARCFACHGALKQESGLRVDTARAMLAGGEGGPAVVPGSAGESPLIDRVCGEGGDRMPPTSEGVGLAADQIAVLRAWIEQGARAPADETPEPDPRDHWAFRPPARPVVPPSPGGNPIDAFLAKRWVDQNLKPQPPAEKGIWLRRVTLDLIGVPPTDADRSAFEADRSPDACEKVVDRLLASPHHGERWGRHWLDVWRYSDWWGLGQELRNSQKHIWHWRDWVVESLNQDVGYDEMIRAMLAADEQTPNDLGRLRATGFLARPYFLFNRNTWLEEVVEHTGKAFLGLTLNCAKCHDHKYDPIGQPDYYRFRAFFEPYQLRTDVLPGSTDLDRDGLPRAFDGNPDAPTFLFIRGDERRPRKDRPIKPGLPALLAPEGITIEPVELPTEAASPGLRAFVVRDLLNEADARVKAARSAQSTALIRSAVASARSLVGSTQGPDLANVPAWILATRALESAESHRVSLRARADADRARAQNLPASALMARASKLARQAALAKAEEDLALAIFAAGKNESKKRDAARKAVEEARKRLDAPGDFYTPIAGARKSAESNVETAESKARRFPTTSTGRRSALARWIADRKNPLTARVAVNHVWMRHFGAPIVPTVADFGRKGTPPTHPELLDWLAVDFMEHGWSMKRLHRLIVTSDAYRRTSSARGADPATLAADPENRLYWRMNPTRMEAQVVRDSLLSLADSLDQTLGGPTVPTKDESSRRRSLYFFHSHNDYPKFLATFDDASVLECYRRSESIVPAQALALSNSKLALAMAGRIADQIARSKNPDFIRAAFERVLGEAPTSAERATCEQALAQWRVLLKARGLADPDQRAQVNLVQALLNHNDFVTIR